MDDQTCILVIHSQIKPDKEKEFVHWQDLINKAVAQFPGYISYTVSAPQPPIQKDWVVMVRFTSKNAARQWLQSPERQNLYAQAQGIFKANESIYLLDEKKEKKANVIATISAKVQPQDEDRFLHWQDRIATIQSTFPGFLGYKLVKPQPGVNDSWITLLTFDNDKHLEMWLNSPDRKKLLDELRSFTREIDIRKVYSGFDFWFNQDKKKSAWKENMLVLLTLYPVVVSLSYFLSPLKIMGTPSWLTLFVSNALSTAVLGSLTVPWLMKTFNWWLYPQKELASKYTWKGTVIVLLLYLLSLFVCRQLFTYWPI